VFFGTLIRNYIKPIHTNNPSIPHILMFIINYIAPFVPGIIFGLAAINIFFELRLAGKWKNAACIVNIMIATGLPLLYYAQGIHDFLQAEYFFALPVIIGIVGLAGNAGMTNKSEDERAHP